MIPEAGTPGLAITSSTGVMGLAVGAAGGSDGHEIEVGTERRHAEELGPSLAELLDRAGLIPADLRWLAVDVGPGRFTGLRVGLATIRGLAFGLGLPVVGRTSLEILAAGLGTGANPGGTDGSEVVTAIIDARRQEVFQQVFVGGEAASDPVVGAPEALADLARGRLGGDGFDRYRDLYGAPARMTDGNPPGGANGAAGRVGLDGRHPRAVDLLRLAAAGPARPGTEIRPLYLRDPDAVANIRTRPEAAAP